MTCSESISDKLQITIVKTKGVEYAAPVLLVQLVWMLPINSSQWGWGGTDQSKSKRGRDKQPCRRSGLKAFKVYNIFKSSKQWQQSD